MKHWAKSVYLLYYLIAFFKIDAELPWAKMVTHNHLSNPQR